MNAETPAWMRYEPIVAGLKPDATDRERELRCRVMAIRDRATQARQRGVEWHADQVLATVEQLGGRFALGVASEIDLRGLIDVMAALYRDAAALQARCPA